MGSLVEPSHTCTAATPLVPVADELHWVPNQTPILSELVLSVRIGDRLIQAIVDSGAGHSYLVCKDPSALMTLHISDNSETAEAPHSVRLADGSLQQIRTVVQAPAQVLDVGGCPILDTTITLRVLESASATGLQLLLGRDVIHKWGLCIKGASLVENSSGKVLFRRPPLHANNCTDATDWAVKAIIHEGPGDVGSQDSLGYHPDPRTDEFIPQIEDDLRRPLDDWLLGLVHQGVRHFGPGLEGPYSMQLRRLEPGEVADTELQRFYFSLSLPPPASPNTSRRVYARQLYDKLTLEARDKYRELIEGYIKRQWWHGVQEADTLPSDLAPAEIFLIGAKSSDKRKPRLVADFKPANAQLPPSTTSGMSIDDVLLVLRTLSPASLFSFDAASAFYRVRLEAVRLLLLHTGLAEASAPDFYSDRLSFGISSGPQSMEESLGWLVTSFRESTFALILVLLAIFVDDGIAGSSDRSVITACLTILYVLCVCGFGCSLEKMQLITAFTDLNCDGFIQPSASMKHLSCSLSYVDRFLRAQCQNEARLADVFSVCVTLSQAGKAAHFTKRDVFKLGGQVSVDALCLHGLWRLIGDAFRRLIGRSCSKIGWDSSIDFEAFSEPLYMAWSELLAWCMDECAPERRACVHDIPYELGPLEAVHLSVFTDASQSGGGYVIFKKHASDELYPIANAAFGWREEQAVWHSNRRELCVLLRALRALVELCSNIKTMCPNPNLKIIVDIGCDNKASVAWVNHTDFSSQGRRAKRSVAVEKRVIQRLVLAVAEEFRALRRLRPAVEYRVYHCPGITNCLADSLSRALDRPCGGTGPLLSTVLASVPRIDFSGQQLVDQAAAQATAVVSDDIFLVNSLDQEVEDNLFLPSPLLDLKTTDVPDNLLRESLCHPAVASADAATAAIDGLLTISDCHAEVDFADTLRLVGDAEGSFLFQRLLCYNSLKSVYRLVAVLRGILRFWNAFCASKKRYPLRQTAQRLAHNAKVTSPQLRIPDRLPIGLQSSGYEIIDVLTVVRLSQQLDDFSKKGRAFVYDQASSMWYFRSGTITGTTLRRPCVPRAAKRYRLLLALDAHARTGHGGPTPRATVMQDDVHVVGATTIAKDVCRRCLPCARLRLRMSSLRWNAPLAGAQWDVDELLRSGNPYSVVCLDFLHLFPGELIFAARCIATSHVSWFRSAHSEECADAALEGVKCLMARWGKVRIAYLDRGTAFTSSSFADTLREEGIELRYHAARAPWETPIERSHAVGLRVLRLNYTPQQLARSSDQDLNRIYDHVCLLINSIPICVHHADSDNRDVITADRLALGYTRSTGILLPMYESESVPNVHIDRPRAIQCVRETFLQHHWQLLRDRCSKAMGKKRGTDLPALTPGTAVLVRMSQRNKLDVGVRLGHVVQPVNPSHDGFVRRYKVRFSSGAVSEESHVNVVAVPTHDAEDCVLGRGAC